MRSISRMAEAGSSSSGLHFAVDRAHLLDQFAHVARTGTRGRLIGHRRHPFDQPGVEQTAHRHQHQRHRAVAADVGFGTAGDAVLDHLLVDRVEDDDGVVLHPQRRSGVDPVAVPARRTQLRVDVLGVVAALRGDDGVALLQFVDGHGVLERGDVLADIGAFAAHVRRGEEHRIDQIEIAFFLHPSHQHGTHHAAPADQSYFHHVHLQKTLSANTLKGIRGKNQSAFTTASPISLHDTFCVPSVQMSPVRRPCAITFFTAPSMRSAVARSAKV